MMIYKKSVLFLKNIDCRPSQSIRRLDSTDSANNKIAFDYFYVKSIFFKGYKILKKIAMFLHMKQFVIFFSNFVLFLKKSWLH